VYILFNVIRFVYIYKIFIEIFLLKIILNKICHKNNLLQITRRICKWKKNHRGNRF